MEELDLVPFGYNPRLEEIHFPDSLTKWGNAVCFKCPSLRRVVLPKHAKDVPWEGFAYCTSLVEQVVFLAPRPEIDSDSFEHTKIAL